MEITPKQGFFTKNYLVVAEDDYFYKLNILHSYYDNLNISRDLYLYSENKFYKFLDNKWNCYDVFFKNIF